MSRRRLLPVLVLAAAAFGGACASNPFSSEGANKFVQDISEFLGGGNPSRHVQNLVELHDAASFEHRPDVPPTYEACLEEIRELEQADYDSWREVALATFFMTRVAVDDQSALNRGEAVRALGRLGGMCFDAEAPRDRPATSEKQVTEAIRRLRAIHGLGGVHVPDDPATAEECVHLLTLVGDLELDRPPNYTDAELRFRLRNLRGILKVIVSTGLAEEDRSEEAQAAVDRTVIAIASQAARLSLMDALIDDDDPTVRASAADILGRLGVESAVAGLRFAMLREKSVSVRREIVQSLGELSADGGRETRDLAVPLLIAALEDDDSSVGFNARSALAALAGEDLGEEAGPWLRWWAGARDER